MNLLRGATGGKLFGKKNFKNNARSVTVNKGAERERDVFLYNSSARFP